MARDTTDFTALAIDTGGTGPDPWEPPEPDIDPPAVSFTQPAEGSVWPAGSTPVAFRFTATDFGTGIAKVEWSADGATYQAATRDTSVANTWTASLPVPARGPRTVWVRATDKSQNQTVVSRSIIVVDESPPDLVVDLPGAEVTDATIKLSVRARDLDPGSGVKAVKWSLDGINFADANRSGDVAEGYSVWTRDIP